MALVRTFDFVFQYKILRDMVETDEFVDDFSIDVSVRKVDFEGRDEFD